MMYGAHRMLRFIFGTLDWQRVVLIVMPGLISGGFVWFIHVGTLWARIGLAVLCVDLVAGALSNATQQTNAQWRTTPRWQRWVFVGAHLLIYPAVVLYLAPNTWLMWGMCAVLLIKLAVFVRGTLWHVSG